MHYLTLISSCLSQSSSTHASRRLEASSVMNLVIQWTVIGLTGSGTSACTNHSIATSSLIKYLRYLLTKHKSGGVTMVIHYGASLQSTIFAIIFKQKDHVTLLLTHFDHATCHQRNNYVYRSSQCILKEVTLFLQ